MKRILLFAMVAMTMFSCAQKGQQQEEATVESFQISELVAEPMAFENQVVRFEGIISHVCRHSGEQMLVVQKTDDSYSIQVVFGELASQFSPEMEGNEVVLVGTMKASVLNADQIEEAHVHEGEEDPDHACESTEEAVRKLKEKGIDPDITAYVELLRVETK